MIVHAFPCALQKELRRTHDMPCVLVFEVHVHVRPIDLTCKNGHDLLFLEIALHLYSSK